MSSKPETDGTSPFASSVLLSQSWRARPSSFSSLANPSQHDKEILTQALDQIHSTASQTETLTTFNEFTSPPSSSSAGDGKGFTSELQGGLSGLYSRLRASVGNVKEIINPLNDDTSADLNPVRNHRQNPAQILNQASDTSATLHPSVISLQSPEIPKPSHQTYQDHSSQEKGMDAQEHAHKKLQPLPGALNVPGKGSLVSSSISHSSLAPVIQVVSCTTASPAVAEINVNAITDRDLSRDTSKDSAISSVNGSKSSLDSKVEAYLGGSVSQNLKVSKESKPTENSHSFAKQSSSKLPSEKIAKVTGRPDDTVIQEPKGDQKRDSMALDECKLLKSDIDNEEIINDKRNTSSGAIGGVHPPSKIIRNPTTSLDEPKTGAMDRIFVGNIEPEGQRGNTSLPSSGKPFASTQVKLTQGLDLQQSYIVAPELFDFHNIQTSGYMVSKQKDLADANGNSRFSQTKLPNTVQHHMDSRTTNIPQIRSKVLSKEYWMRDENARDCFFCGDPFSTFRRKHHCRTCGQIFDSKCTSIIPGGHFGQLGPLRVCKPCEGIINGYDDSSEFSDDSNLPVVGLRPRHGSTSASDALATPGSRSSTPVTEDLRQSPKHHGLPVPTMAIPATRRAGGEANRKSVLEIDAEHTLLRPSSSRSLKSAQANKSHPMGHRRHNSRHLHQRGSKLISEESAPFHQIPTEEKGKQGRLPAFHDDSIIDPDLAPFLPDEDSSGDEQVSIAAAINGDLAKSYDNERHGYTGLLSSSRKGRSRFGDKSTSGLTLASRDADNHSLCSMKSINLTRSSRRRNLSVAGNLHLRSSPRTYRASALLPTLAASLHENSSASGVSQVLASSMGSRMIRSSSMRGTAAPAVELNNASLQHVRNLLRQLLNDSGVPGISSWEKALIPILLQATDDVNPDVLNGDDIDIRHYVKLKKIPGGRPGDTAYVSGLVFTKNLALKSMPRSISEPSILILTFPLEYARHQQHFMSLEPVIRQEREFLQNLVNRIVDLRPQLLLVERNISGLALDFLEQANIATAYNVKPSVLEAVSRCTQTRIISSMDKLAVKPAQTGKCSTFHLKTYVNENKKKTYMFLSGCAKELGCTIVLRGGQNEILAKIKKITEFMIYVVYNLKLETCLMRDEFALIPSSYQNVTLAHTSDSTILASSSASTAETLQTEASGDTNGVDDAKTSSKGKQRSEKEHTEQAMEQVVKPKVLHTTSIDDSSMPEDVPMPTYYGDMVEQHKTKILSASPFVKFAPPYILMRAREQERRLAYLKRLRDQDMLDQLNDDEGSRPQKFDLIRPEMIHGIVQGTSRKVREVIHAVHDAEYDKALYNYKTHTKQWEAYLAGNINMFDPYEHQNIAVLYSLVCTVTTVPCSGPDLLALSFYCDNEVDEEFEADCTLGQYVEDLCLGANTVCTANGCERRMFDHHRQYVHGEAQVSVFVEQYPCKLRGLQNTILMWSRCRICDMETQVMPMSESSWKYSFGKYLELSFWSSNLRARADICPHDLHKDHLRYFGFQDVALRFHYDPINLLEIVVPRGRVTWKVDNDLHFKNELYLKIEDRLNKYMASVKNRIKSIKVESVAPEKIESCEQKIEELMLRACDEHKVLLHNLQELYMNSKHYEIIPLNQAMRAAQEKVAEWDEIFKKFDHDYFPSEKDIRRLAALQLRRIFLDRDYSDTSSNCVEGSSIVDRYESDPSSNPTEKSSISSVPEGASTEKPQDGLLASAQARAISPEKAQNMLSSVVERHPFNSLANENESISPPQNASISLIPLIGSNSDNTEKMSENNEVKHLDLAGASCMVKPVDCRDLVDLPTSESRNQKLLESEGVETKHDQQTKNLGSPGRQSNEIDLAPKPNQNQSEHSNIPRASELINRRSGRAASPPFYRTKSQPTQVQSERSSNDQLKLARSDRPDSSSQTRKTYENVSAASLQTKKSAEKKLPDRFGLGALKPSNVAIHSMIPRSISSHRNNSNVSTLARRFEQLSREFEKERIRDRKQRAAKDRQARAQPMAVSRPIIEIYRDVREAVEEREPSDEDILSSDPSRDNHEESPSTTGHMTETTDSLNQSQGSHIEDTTADTTETEETYHMDSQTGSDVEGEGGRSEEEHTVSANQEVSETVEMPRPLSPAEAQLDLKLDLPKHEKSSLMSMLSKFWAERSASGWQPLDYPLNVSDHIFADSDIIVREDEPSSLIAFALGSENYQEKLRTISENFANRYRRQQKSQLQDSMLDNDEQLEVERSLLGSTGTHLKYQFQEGTAKMLCKIFFAEQFDAVRRKCGVDQRIVESLSRCLKWDSKGGKTKSVFLKTLDDRFVLKSLSPIETQAFLRFAPAYFRIVSASLFHNLPSVIAKMFGFYQIIIKNPATGIEFNWFLLVMENLFYDRSPVRIFDLKGSMRNRRIQSTGEQNEVLLDENMVEFIYESPLFSREHSKRILRASVWNDTLFLARQNVMDYSLMIAIDEKRKELVVGIIDCIRTYTWDKRLETWIKDRGKNRPTVTSPREYKNRFREAMGRYVLQAPNCWHQFKAQQAETRPLQLDHLPDVRDGDGDGELPRIA